MAFSESHLNDSVKESEYCIPNFSHITSNRINRSKGGVIIYLHNHLSYKILNKTSDDACSFLAVLIIELNLVVMIAYRPPPDYDGHLYGKPLKQSFFSTIINSARATINLLKTPIPDIILTGDFNFPKAIWREGFGIIPEGNSFENQMLKQLINLCDDFQLSQKVSFGTRPTPSGGSNTLDLIFTNNHQLITEISHRKSALSDHELITCSTSHTVQFNSPSSVYQKVECNLASYNLNKANWDQIRQSIAQIDWPQVFDACESQEIMNTFLSRIISIVEAHCAKYVSSPGHNNSKIPRDRRLLFRQRKRKLKRRNMPTINSNMKSKLDIEIEKIESKLIKSHLDERSLEEKKAVANIKDNPKFFYSFAKKYQKVKSSIGPLKVNNALISDPHDICVCLSNQYSSSYSVPNPENAISDPSEFFSLTNANNALLDICFNERDIERQIDSLKTNTSPGPDHFPAKLLKMCKKELSIPIYHIWRKSLDSGYIVPIFLHGVVCPVLKPRSESYLPKSYRPISLTSHIIKIFEKIVKSAILKHLEDNNLLPINQHGFLKGKSTLSQLLCQVENITRILESDRSVDTIYLDFAKAFDKVDHHILCHKMKSLLIGGKVGIWLHSFLSNRTQQISANGALSPPSSVLSGVPQGTVLGPVLFMIMIMDLDSNLSNSFASMFADDTRVSASISCEADAQSFQKELSEVIYPWAPQNKAQFNGNKFEHIHFGKSPVPVRPYYDPSNNAIIEKSVIKDLGVWVTNDLTWNFQIDMVISDSRKQIAWILRTFTSRDPNTMRSLWISLIRPILDYCSPLWSPMPTNYGNIDRLEGVLRTFTKHIEGLQTLSYTERLKALNLQSIQRRHERFKIIYMFKIKEGLVPNLPLNPSDPSGPCVLRFKTSIRDNNRCELYKPVLHHNPAAIQRSCSFAFTACNLWNCLPPWLRSVSNCSVDKFKNLLDKFLNVFPDEPRCNASGLFTDQNTGRLSNSVWHLRSHNSIKANIHSLNVNY